MKSHRRFSFFRHRACVAAMLLGLTSASHAAVTTYTSQTAFLGAVQNTVYLETFNDRPGDFVQGPETFMSNGIGFTLTDVGSGYVFYSTAGAGQGSVFPTGLSYTDSFRITFTSGITAVGGTFFLSTPSFIPESGGDVTATLSTGETLTLSSTASYATEPFGGFISTTPITSLTLTGTHIIGGMGAYLSMDNLIVAGVAAPVPEPESMALMGAGLLAMWMTSRSRRRTR